MSEHKYNEIEIDENTRTEVKECVDATRYINFTTKEKTIAIHLPYAVYIDLINSIHYDTIEILKEVSEQ